MQEELQTTRGSKPLQQAWQVALPRTPASCRARTQQPPVSERHLPGTGLQGFGAACQNPRLRCHRRLPNIPGHLTAAPPQSSRGPKQDCRGPCPRPRSAPPSPRRRRRPGQPGTAQEVPKHKASTRSLDSWRLLLSACPCESVKHGRKPSALGPSPKL